MTAPSRVDVLAALRAIFRAELQEPETGHFVLQSQTLEGPALFDVADLDMILDRLAGADASTEARVALIWPERIEVLIREEAAYPTAAFTRRREERLRLEDADAQLSYAIGPPSPEFSICFCISS
ncbi:hypothetical protein [Blastococcus montanus]|uniref:hypothetical protein n=1 Tax=Blastococcus montanus TaxID=3144973 RepID=UPI0032096173